MVAERARVRRLIVKNQHTQRCPSLVLPQRARDDLHTRLLLRGNNLMPLLIGLRQPAGNVGQQAKNNLRV
ncbi:hypothetical protein CTY88_11815 [Acinetobacter seifertii]|uniref:Uncharacterized protein n=1 Tax=Acinetobacter genomosp. 33YU TaxID=1675530 RepID=A0A1V2UY44_9GAMM|nr:hypothetical protein [Acinetobacter seifertii]ONN54817.1 hypothetical protein AC058_07710 [Acinetobacter genomosp. 33YU]